ncbi:unnamed protein product [Strongylus vulgaris]|uniref:Uncharacterized protein n=1 Tax=Strongylus vulgaris TaxID=40348 RepID=A0A3P7JWF4_STRVU|nr:unnamed protein product [Strongylus vulgaris]
MAMPHDFNPQAQQFHLGLVHHLKLVQLLYPTVILGRSFMALFHYFPNFSAAMPSRTGPATATTNVCPPPVATRASEPPKWAPGTPPASDTSSSESPEPPPSSPTKRKESRPVRPPHHNREDPCDEPPCKKVWQPWQ